MSKKSQTSESTSEGTSNSDIAPAPIDTPLQRRVTNNQARFGGRLMLFSEVSNHNWEIKGVTETVVSRKRDEEDGQWMEKRKIKVRVTDHSFTITRYSSDGRGGTREEKVTKTLKLPFVTFDNQFIEDGFTPREVAEAVWNCQHLGTTLEAIPFTDEDVEDYFVRKQSPAMRRIQEQLINGDRPTPVQSADQILVDQNRVLQDDAANRDASRNYDFKPTAQPTHASNPYAMPAFPG